MNFFRKYGFSGSLYIFYCLVRTKFVFANARLIRFPIDIRGRKNISVGKNFTTGRGCRIEALPAKNTNDTLIEIGDDVQINDYVHITATLSVKIKSNVLIAGKVYISDTGHGSYNELYNDASHPSVAPAQRPLTTNPVVIEENVWLGDSVCVLPGVTIGKGSIIGANAVVTKNIPPQSIAVGIPAKVIKYFDEQLKQWVAVHA